MLHTPFRDLDRMGIFTKGLRDGLNVSKTEQSVKKIDYKILEPLPLAFERRSVYKLGKEGVLKEKLCEQGRVWG